MMKYALLIIGAAISITAIAKLATYLQHYANLTAYGQGYVWGNVILLVVGLALLFLGWRIKKRTK